MCVSGIGVLIFTSWALSRVDVDVGVVITNVAIAETVAVSMAGK